MRVDPEAQANYLLDLSHGLRIAPELRRQLHDYYHVPQLQVARVGPRSLWFSPDPSVDPANGLSYRQFRSTVFSPARVDGGPQMVSPRRVIAADRPPSEIDWSNR